MKERNNTTNDMESDNNSSYLKEKISVIGKMIFSLVITSFIFYVTICLYYGRTAPIFIYVFSFIIFGISFMLMFVGFFNGILGDQVKEEDNEVEK